MAVLRVVLSLVMVLARALPFLLAALLVFLLWRRSRRAGEEDGPEFKGPVVTVDYVDVEDEEREQGEEDRS